MVNKSLWSKKLNTFTKAMVELLLKLVGGSVYHKLNTMTPCFSKGEHEYFWSSPDGSKIELNFLDMFY